MRESVSFLRTCAEDQRRAGNDELALNLDTCADEIENLRRQCAEGISKILAQVKHNKEIIDDALRGYRR